MYRDAPNSARFSTLKFGIWVLDLKAHLQAQVDGTSKIRYFHNVRFFFLGFVFGELFVYD